MLDFTIFAGDVQGVDEEQVKADLKGLQRDICDRLELPINEAYDERLAALEAGLWTAVGEEEIRRAFMKLDIEKLTMHGEIEAAVFWAGVRVGVLMSKWNL